MKRIFIPLFLLLLCSPWLFGFDQTEDYSNALLQKDPVQRIQALEAYLTKYPAGSEFHKYVYAQLAIDYVDRQNYSKAFEYAKKVENFLGEMDLEEQSKAGLFLVLGAYYFSQNNSEKALNYAEKVINLSANKQEEVWKRISASALKIKAAVQTSPLDAATNLYNQKKYLEAEKAFSDLYKSNKSNFEVVVWYAKCLDKNGKTDAALKMFKEAYVLKKDGLVAYNIGIILNRQAKTNRNLIPEAINYFLEASWLLPAKSSEMMNIARSLFFGNYKDQETALDFNGLIKRLEEMNAGLKALTDEFNKKYVGKTEEEVDEAQMKTDIQKMEAFKKELAKIQAKIKKAEDEFNKLAEAAKIRVKSKEF